MSDWDVLDRQFDAVGQPNDPKSFYKINTLRDLIDNLNERLTAMETARATAPVSDDELVEALAKTVWCAVNLRNRGREGSWPDDATNLRAWRDDAREQLVRLRADRYDVVKRS